MAAPNPVVSPAFRTPRETLSNDIETPSVRFIIVAPGPLLAPIAVSPISPSKLCHSARVRPRWKALDEPFPTRLTSQ
jgi:hypothetical protein